jgi:16S rRNA processing protein RimM
VALVRGLRGLRGQVRVELLTDRPEDRFTAGTALLPEGTDERLTIDEASPVADGPGWWLTFREIHSREAAERLRDLYLEIEAPDEPREPGRWFFHELEGLAVRTVTGEDLGTIEEIYRAGGAEVFVVRGPRGELDVPGVRGIVTDLAPERGEMIVDLDALALDARPVDDEDYVRPRDRRPKAQPKPKPKPRTAPAPTGAGAPGRSGAKADSTGGPVTARPPKTHQPKVRHTAAPTPSAPGEPAASPASAAPLAPSESTVAQPAAPESPAPDA